MTEANQIDSKFVKIDSSAKRNRLSFLQWLAIWRERAASRKTLAALDEHMLRDIGITRYEARQESRRSFWDGETAPYWSRIRR